MVSPTACEACRGVFFYIYMRSRWSAQDSKGLTQSRQPKIPAVHSVPVPPPSAMNKLSRGVTQYPCRLIPSLFAEGRLKQYRHDVRQVR